MPFKYKRKDTNRNRSNLNLLTIKNALSEIDNGKSVRSVGLKYGIDRNTLGNYLKDRTKLTKISEHGSQFKTALIFSTEEEKTLVEYLLICSKMNYGLTRQSAMKLAYEYATHNSKKVPNSWNSNNCAGKDWFRGFMKRNPELSLRTPEATSLSRSTSFNKKNVTDFFENLKEVREKYKFEPHNIYNCDETGCTTVQVCPKVLASKHVRQVGQVTSAERGSLVTVCFAVNALGNAIPPFFVFPRVKYNESFVASGPPGSQGDSYPSGWMTTKSFLKFMEHFVKYSNASLQNRILLILDNHESHVSIEVIKYAKINGVTLLTIPPHCSNKLQPLDVAIYSSFKARYNSAMNNWMLSNPGRTVTIYNIPGFVNTVMSKAFSQSNILSGFRKTGIHPYDPDIFTDDDFLCSAVTNRELTNELQEQDVSSISLPSTAVELPLDFTTTELPSTSTVQSQSKPSTSASVSMNETVVSRANSPSILAEDGSEQAIAILKPSAEVASPSQDQETAVDRQIVLPQMIRPFPKAAPRKRLRRGRQPGKTKILTKTPEKSDPIDESTPKNKKNKMPKKKQKGKAKKRTVKRQVLQSSDSETELDEEPKYDDSGDSPWEEVPDLINSWFCFICGEDKVMDMRLCAYCGKYVHEVCVGLSKKDKEQLICPNCTN